uniref:AAA ATPase domain-containing protein n=1 Tax=Candidatus Kentrum sp. FM TaxID=2126340 RepID=A0A450T2Q5_9GAMM|nr:MAG: hypothetical protein BECKFM1743A_GA0114220_102083 [Candidatus Kentron sp. FM]VFJ60570.1 MAG: hypothetical protein BECKFM1743C_GA0114222_102761 [Candidatus Kentron sp. FM]VFK13788.1 MAG: hypothetical protein BECKFM1743B_GA0114221_102941 [Candidatus Kentron sp. FM]
MSTKWLDTIKKKRLRLGGFSFLGMRWEIFSPGEPKPSATPEPSRPQPIAPATPQPTTGPIPAPGAPSFLPHGLHQLKTYGGGFAGRREELAELDAAWASGVRVFVLHAEGGAGKTRLLVKWLAGLRDGGWRGAGGVFVHSFYSQGAGERRNASSDLFFQQALAYFGNEGGDRGAGRAGEGAPTDPMQKAERLARLVVARRALLILDGLEPLQHPPAFNGGQLKDPALERLLLLLAGAPAGSESALCVITSRQPVVELGPYRGGAVLQRSLASLDAAAGVALLREFQIRGTDEELAAAVAEYHGHAYSLMLLGSYLNDITYDRHIRHRVGVPLLEQDKEQGGHAGRLFRAYIVHLGAESPEVALLRLLGFFDRPAARELLAVLGPSTESVHEGRDLDPRRDTKNKTFDPRRDTKEHEEERGRTRKKYSIFSRSSSFFFVFLRVPSCPSWIKMDIIFRLSWVGRSLPRPMATAPQPTESAAPRRLRRPR